MQYRVRAVVINRHDNLITVEKIFKTEAARTRWLDQQSEVGRLHQVLAYSEEA